VKSVSFTYREFNDAVGYDPKFIVQGFNVMDEEKSDAASAHFGLGSNTHLPPTDKAKYEDALDRIKELESTEREVQSTARIEQAYLRKQLFPNRTAQCAICGKTYPKDVMVAAHIKRRAACSRDEKLDAANIVMPVCKMGCDELYERGYIAVDESGTIITGSAPTSDLSDYLGKVDGNTCTAHSVESAKYFDWHHKSRFGRNA
jgi:predicted restriction endonuclease